MASFILRIYDYMKTHRSWCALVFFVLSGLLVFQLTRLDYKEDISDFLPLDSRNQEAMSIYQNISGANQLFAMFECRDSTSIDPDLLIAAVNGFTETLEASDTTHLVSKVTAQIDIEHLSDIVEYTYQNIPYFLDENDYQRFDSLLSSPDYYEKQLRHDKELLMLPGGGLLSDNIGRDPFNLFTPIVSLLQRSSSDMSYELYDGYIFSPDMKKAIIIIGSPFGSSETEMNSQLVGLLESCAASTMSEVAGVDIHITGGPAIAVGNSQQIKRDSYLSITLAIIIILLLLFLAFRNVRNLLLIAISIGWGWLFGLGGLALFHNDVSIIVLGISSVILGIAVNYPLHLIAHLYHCSDMRTALREIVSPLIVGNITTVGAFLCLYPLHSIALKDLGLFSSLLLVGTILFVLMFLPHLAKAHRPMNHPLLERISSIQLENRPTLIIAVVILTLIFGYFSTRTVFDTNMSHINYMTDQQKKDMEYFQEMMRNASDNQVVYVVSSAPSMDEALDHSLEIQPYLKRLQSEGEILAYSGCSRFIISQSEQKRRIGLWKTFVARYGDEILANLKRCSKSEGFAEDSFEDFASILKAEYANQENAYFDPLKNSIFAAYLCTDTVAQVYNVVDVLTVSPPNVAALKETLQKSNIGSFNFDVQGMSSEIANALSDNFNYICWACGIIVFLFLWFSLGSIELALLSFLPMTISWVWILGIMGLLDINFNIVNIILATFIFGQGDDYTIFMTEGSSYEYAYRKKMLTSYKSSIILSAMIMFVGIGSLIVARHPALRSLAEITIVGMFSVVLMAYIFPPLIFKMLVKKKESYRLRPISVKPFFAKLWSSGVHITLLTGLFVIGGLLFAWARPGLRKKERFGGIVRRAINWYFRHIAGVRYEIRNEYGHLFEEPLIIAYNDCSKYAFAILVSLTQKPVVISNKSITLHFMERKILEWTDFIILRDDIDVPSLMAYKEKNYGFAVPINGTDDIRSLDLRQCEQVGNLSESLGIGIIPVIIHGIKDTMSMNSYQIYSGRITVGVYKTVDDYTTTTNAAMSFYDHYTQLYDQLVAELECADYFVGFVLDRYKYKGVEVLSAVRRNINNHKSYSQWIDVPVSPSPTFIADTGLGEFAMLFSLVHKGHDVTLLINDDDKATLAKYSLSDVAGNVNVLSSLDDSRSLLREGQTVYLVHPTELLLAYFSPFHPIIIQ